MPRPFHHFDIVGVGAKDCPRIPSRAGQEAGRYKGTRSWSRLLRHHALSVSGALWRGRGGRAAQDLLHKKRGFSKSPGDSALGDPRAIRTFGTRRSREPSTIRTIPSALDFHQILLSTPSVHDKLVGFCLWIRHHHRSGIAPRRRRFLRRRCGRGLTLPRRSYYNLEF